MKINILLVFLFFLSWAFGQSVEQRIQNELKFQVLPIISHAIQTGLTQVGGVNLKELEKNIPKLEIKLAQVYAAGGRTSAMWLENTILIDPNKLSNMNATTLHTLLLHDAIGATFKNYKDDGYAVSIYLNSVFNPEVAPVLRQFSFPEVAQNIHPIEALKKGLVPNVSTQSFGGSTTVGGGGDGRDIEIKLETLRALSLLQKSQKHVMNHDIRELAKAILLINIFQTDLVADDDEFSVGLNRAVNLTPILFLHPNEYQKLLRLKEVDRIMAMVKLAALLIEQKVFADEK